MKNFKQSSVYSQLRYQGRMFGKVAFYNGPKMEDKKFKNNYKDHVVIKEFRTGSGTNLYNG